MPYKTNAELPKAVLTALPSAAQSIFRGAFNSHSSKNPDASEAACFKVAWAAVANAGWHAPTGGKGQWTHDEKHEGKGAKFVWPTAGADGVPVLSLDDGHLGALEVYETIVLDADAKTRLTSDGYLVAFPRVARTGIQLYKGSEVGRPGMDQVRVYRPENEIFSRDSMASYAGKPVTNDHPPVLVDAANWKEYSVGDIGDEVMRDGTFLRVPMMLRDSKAIDDFRDGKDQLSLGYTMDLKWESGQTDTGEAYDAIQTNVRANHLAVVTAARGGPALKIGDDKDRSANMTTKQITVDGLKVTLDERDADIVLRAMDTAAIAIKAAQAAADKAAADLKARDEQIAADKKAVEGKDAEIATLKQQLKDAVVTPAKLNEMVKDLATVSAKAKQLVGDKVAVDGKSIDEIRRAVVDIKLGATAKDWTADQVSASFDSFAAGVGDGRGNLRGDPVRDVIRDGIHSSADAREAAYDAMVTRNENAWKGTANTKT